MRLVKPLAWLVFLIGGFAVVAATLPPTPAGTASVSGSGASQAPDRGAQFDALYRQMSASATREQPTARALWSALANAIAAKDRAAISTMLNDWKYRNDLSKFASDEFMSQFDLLKALYDPRR